MDMVSQKTLFMPIYTKTRLLVRACTCELWLYGRRFNTLSLRFHITTLGKLFTHVCLLSPNIVVTSQKTVMPYVSEGNRKSGIILAKWPCHGMPHRLKQFIHLRVQFQG